MPLSPVKPTLLGLEELVVGFDASGFSVVLHKLFVLFAKLLHDLRDVLRSLHAGHFANHHVQALLIERLNRLPLFKELEKSISDSAVSVLIEHIADSISPIPDHLFEELVPLDYVLKVLFHRNVKLGFVVVNPNLFFVAVVVFVVDLNELVPGNH